VRLQAHIGRELAFALGRTIEPDRTVKIFVAGVIGALRRGVPRLGNCARVELACAMSGADKRTDNTLKVDLI